MGYCGGRDSSKAWCEPLIGEPRSFAQKTYNVERWRSMGQDDKERRERGKQLGANNLH